MKNNWTITKKPFRYIYKNCDCFQWIDLQPLCNLVNRHTSNYRWASSLTFNESFHPGLMRTNTPIKIDMFQRAAKQCRLWSNELHLSRVVHVSLQACQSIKAPDPLRQCRSTWQMLDIAGLYQTRWQCNLPSWCYLFRKCMKLLIAETVLPTNVSCSKVINRHPYFMELFALFFILFTRFAKLFLIAPNSGDCKFRSKSALECGPERGRNVQVMSKYFGSRPWFYCFNLPGEAMSRVRYALGRIKYSGNVCQLRREAVQVDDQWRISNSRSTGDLVWMNIFGLETWFGDWFAQLGCGSKISKEMGNQSKLAEIKLIYIWVAMSCIQVGSALRLCGVNRNGHLDWFWVQSKHIFVWNTGFENHVVYFYSTLRLCRLACKGKLHN